MFFIISEKDMALMITDSKKQQTSVIKPGEKMLSVSQTSNLS